MSLRRWCRRCNDVTDHVRGGYTSTLNPRQRYKCLVCGGKDIGNENYPEYDDGLKELALKMIEMGYSYRQAADELKVSHQAIYYWRRGRKDRQRQWKKTRSRQ
jgi:transposase-like protein